jgi:hypothetical protein
MILRHFKAIEALYRKAELGDHPGDEKADSKVTDACAKHFTEKDLIARKGDSLQIAR